MVIKVIPPDEAKKSIRMKVKAWKERDEKRHKQARIRKAQSKAEALQNSNPNPSQMDGIRTILSPEEQQDLEDKLLNSSKHGDLEEARRLLDLGANPNSRGDRATTPLIEACRQGHAVVAEFLIKKGADVDEIDGYGNTALICAAGQGKLEAVRLLLDNGADFDSENNSRMTALMSAVLYRHNDVAKLLRRYGAKT